MSFNKLVFLVQGGDMNKLKEMVEGEIDCDINTGNMLAEACSFGRLDVAKYLVEKGADIHADKELALSSTFDSGSYMRIDIIKFLLSCGANLEIAMNNCYKEDMKQDVIEYLNSLKDIPMR
jgi:ankyrin repeat protein